MLCVEPFVRNGRFRELEIGAGSRLRKSGVSGHASFSPPKLEILIPSLHFHLLIARAVAILDPSVETDPSSSRDSKGLWFLICGDYPEICFVEHLEKVVTNAALILTLPYIDKSES